MSTSSGSSSNVRKGFCNGIPRKCWCDERAVTLVSNSVKNPKRKYYRCEKAAINKWKDDDHVFKWRNEAVHDEVETMVPLFEVIVRDVAQLKVDNLEMQKMFLDKIEEQNKRIKIVCVIVVVGFLFVAAMIKLV